MDKDANINLVNRWVPENYVKIADTEAEKIIYKGRD
jgi:hypothetical protein